MNATENRTSRPRPKPKIWARTGFTISMITCLIWGSAHGSQLQESENVIKRLPPLHSSINTTQGSLNAVNEQVVNANEAVEMMREIPPKLHKLKYNLKRTSDALKVLRWAPKLNKGTKILKKGVDFVRIPVDLMEPPAVNLDKKVLKPVNNLLTKLNEALDDTHNSLDSAKDHMQFYASAITCDGRVYEQLPSNPVEHISGQVLTVIDKSDKILSALNTRISDAEGVFNRLKTGINASQLDAIREVADVLNALDEITDGLMPAVYALESVYNYKISIKVKSSYTYLLPRGFGLILDIYSWITGESTVEFTIRELMTLPDDLPFADKIQEAVDQAIMQLLPLGKYQLIADAFKIDVEEKLIEKLRLVDAKDLEDAIKKFVVDNLFSYDLLNFQLPSIDTLPFLDKRIYLLNQVPGLWNSYFIVETKSYSSIYDPYWFDYFVWISNTSLVMNEFAVDSLIFYQPYLPPFTINGVEVGLNDMLITDLMSEIQGLKLQIKELKDFGIINCDFDDWGTLNLSHYGTARQSSNFNSRWTADVAIDGNTDGYISNDSTTHTAAGQYKPWWEIDLGESWHIDNVRLYNRTDCCSERLSNFDILVSDTPFGDHWVNPSHYQNVDVGSVGDYLEVGLKFNGRYLRVQLRGYAPLSLAEVEVMGSNLSVATDSAQ